MPRNTSGTYTKPDGTTAVTGTPISSSAYNNLANDIGSALTDSLSRSGKGGMQADLALNGKKVTLLAPGTADSDALRRDQVVSLIRQGVYGGVSTGSANAQVLTMSPALPGYFQGMLLTFIAGFANTGATTLNINGLGAIPITKPGGGLDPGDITANGITVVVYSGVAGAWSLLNPKAPLDLGSAAFRGVGTDVGDLPEIANASGQFQPAVDVAHKSLNNLTGAGIQRTTWASIAFAGATAVVAAAFNGAAVARNAVGLYTITFPLLAGVYQVAIDLDVAVSATGFNAAVVTGSRSNTQVQISTMQGNSGVDPFDPDRVTVSIHSIG
ncbi:hypothetical protein AB4Z01_15090 [Inquilinus sp. YAF38]|uniref:hypothetical protein n=1 Tax=Inquilinus sp. YAF38 TaxID=3233084 RepID=UPI003F91C21D